MVSIQVKNEFFLKLGFFFKNLVFLSVGSKHIQRSHKGHWMLDSIIKH
jgi:hypothetical protein